LRRHTRFAGLAVRCLLFPAHQQQVRQVLDDVAQGVDVGVGGVEQNCRLRSPGSTGLQRIVGKADHADQALRFGGGQIEAFVEQRFADRDGDGQVVRGHHGPRMPESGGGSFGSTAPLAALHQERDALVEVRNSRSRSWRSLASTSNDTSMPDAGRG
jgi:hypothetical protein